MVYKCKVGRSTYKLMFTMTYYEIIMKPHSEKVWFTPEMQWVTVLQKFLKVHTLDLCSIRSGTLWVISAQNCIEFEQAFKINIMHR